MERNLNHDDFDEFLRENADGLRMPPSDRVWQNINRELDRRKRRFGAWFALSLFLLSGAYITYEISITTQRGPWTQPTPVYAAAARTATQLPEPIGANQQVIAITPVAAKQPASRTASLRLRRRPAKQPGQQTTAAPETAAIAPARLAYATAIAPTDTALAQPAPSGTATEPATEPLARLELPEPEVTHEVIAAAQPTALSTSTAPPIPTTQAPVPKRTTHKLSWQIFATPTISYRVLSDNKSYRRPLLTPNIPANFSALYGINDAVIHKPDLGLEFGVMARYALGKSVKLRTGFQFNVSRYDIKAFSFVPEVATIALSNGFGVDSVRAISNYRNFAGGRTNWLQNFYFQASMPIGLEVKIAGNSRTYWGVASSVQPTYLIGNRSYMITADYKNYARVPWLSRRWNMNTSFETFVSVNSGKTQWQVGPQVRYQLLSSFIRQYPVKENLFDFGLKVGVTLK